MGMTHFNAQIGQSSEVIVKRLALALALAAILALPALAAPFQHFKASMSGSTNYLVDLGSPRTDFDILLNGAGGYVTLYWYKDLNNTVVDSVSIRCPAGIKMPFNASVGIHQARVNRDDIVAEVFITTDTQR
jgi:hypothetical protein